MTDYAIMDQDRAMLLKRKYPLFNIFMFRTCFDLFVLNFRNVRLKSVNFLVNCVFFIFLLPPYLQEITIIHVYAEKILKNKDIHNASLACIINSMPEILIIICAIWVLTSSFFGTLLKPHCLIFSPQVMQENWITYCSMKIQNYLCDKL